MVAAKDSVAGKRVAIKKIKDAVEDDSDGKRLLRELKVDTLKLCPRSCFAYASCDNAAFGRICLCAGVRVRRKPCGVLANCLTSLAEHLSPQLTVHTQHIGLTCVVQSFCATVADTRISSSSRT